MNHLFTLELVGDDSFQYLRQVNARRKAEGLSVLPNSRTAWVAEITGTDPEFGFQRTFLRGFKDYAKAKGTGARGIYLYLTVQDGKVYEIRQQLSFTKSDRRFCRFEQGKEIRMTREEVLQWLHNSSGPSESTS